MSVFTRRGAWFSLLLFFCLSALSTNTESQEKTAAISRNDCNFSLTEEVPRNIQFTVQAGRIAFLCKAEDFFLRGTVTRTLDWQLTGKIFEAMAENLKAETLDKWPSGRLYRIKGDAKSQQKSLICGYHSRDQYSMDLCAPEGHGGPRVGGAKEGGTTTEGHGGSGSREPRKAEATEGHGGSVDGNRARNMVLKLLQEFRKMALEKSPLLKSAPLFAQKRVFTEENETREPALLALSMPAGYVEVTRRENRALFTDAAGLAEMEIFYEVSDLSLDSELAHRVYRKSISAFLSRQGPWRPVGEDNIVKKDDAVCLLYTDNGSRLSNYCYVVAPITIAEKKKFTRVAFVVAFAREAVDKDRLIESQQALLNSWATIIRKHTN